MSKITHLLFDCDGVLVDTEYLAAVKMTRALQHLGIDISCTYYLQNLSGTTFSSIVYHYLGDALSGAEVLTLVNRVEAEVAAEVRPVAGVKELLAGLPQHKSVVSNSAVSTVKHALKVAGIDQYFSVDIFSSELVSKPKPAPDVYQLAINTLACEPAAVIVVEDSLSGVKAAMSAGLHVIGFAGASHILPGHQQKLFDLGVKNVANNMQELGTLLTAASPA
jgi:HAD superfamily hydrolase (TIGR01509 family)